MFSECAALPAMTNAIDRAPECFGQCFCAIAIALEQIKCHALRRFRANAWQTA
jgi:hypothetical protein